MSGVCYDVVVIIDDASPILPKWGGMEIAREISAVNPEWNAFIFSFQNRLGRSGMFDMPGWYRSFSFSSDLARHLKCDRILHVESDAYLLSHEITEFIDTTTGWSTVWVGSKEIPETGIQVIAADALSLYRETVSSPYDRFRGHAPERVFPFTNVECKFRGDRHGETSTSVPWDADWTMQTPNGTFDSKESEGSYFWFLDQRRAGHLEYNPRYLAKWIEMGDIFVSVGGLGWRIIIDGYDKWIAYATSAGIIGYFDTADICARTLLRDAEFRGTYSEGRQLLNSSHVTIPSVRAEYSTEPIANGTELSAMVGSIVGQNQRWLRLEIDLKEPGLTSVFPRRSDFPMI